MSFVNQVSVPMMTSGWTVSIKTGSSVRLFLMLWKLIIKVLKVVYKQDIKYVESTITEIQNLKSKNINHIFLLRVDFNLPDINWKMNDVTGNQVPKAISKTLFPIGGRVLHLSTCPGWLLNRRSNMLFSRVGWSFTC
jgi:hypothetical protein